MKPGIKGSLLLEDGTLFTGRSFGHDGISGGELIFNTAMTGYQEVLTDPSYYGQILVMTYPLMGNYGVNSEDIESRKIFLSGFVVGSYIHNFSNWRGKLSLSEFLKKEKIVAIDNIDTRALTRRLRSAGTVRAVLGTDSISVDELKNHLRSVPRMEGSNFTGQVACKKRFEAQEVLGDRDFADLKGARPHIVVMDCGVKYSILRNLLKEGAQVTVVPPNTSAEDIKRLKPHGVLISNGPGDPDAVTGLPKTIRKLIGTVPIFGICLGHQLLSLAIGAKTYKLKFGHHGANHPVRNELNQKIEITSQNHGFAVDGDSLEKISDREFGPIHITHIHLSDGTIEGFQLPEVNVQAIQYHPEASPGPHDAQYLFQEFVQCTRTSLNA